MHEPHQNAPVCIHVDLTIEQAERFRDTMAVTVPMSENVRFWERVVEELSKAQEEHGPAR